MPSLIGWAHTQNDPCRSQLTVHQVAVLGNKYDHSMCCTVREKITKSTHGKHPQMYLTNTCIWSAYRCELVWNDGHLRAEVSYIKFSLMNQTHWTAMPCQSLTHGQICVEHSKTTYIFSENFLFSFFVGEWWVGVRLARTMKDKTQSIWATHTEQGMKGTNDTSSVNMISFSWTLHKSSGTWWYWHHDMENSFPVHMLMR